MTLRRDSVCLSLFSPLSSSSMSFTWSIRCDGSVRLNKLKGTHTLFALKQVPAQTSEYTSSIR